MIAESTPRSAETKGDAVSNQVLVVGAGPTGLILCNELLRRGIRCRLIEKRAAPSRTTRAFTLHARTMEMFDHMGLARRIDELREVCPGNLFHFKGCNAAERKAPVLDFRQLEGTAYNYYGKVNQCDLDRILRENLAARYSFYPEFGKEYVESKVSPCGTSVEAQIRDVATGAVEGVRSQWLVGTDGSASSVRRSLGAAFEQGSGEQMTMSMVDAELDQFTGDATWVNYFVADRGFMLVTRLPGGKHRLYLAGEMEKLLETHEPKAAFQAGLDHFNTGAKITALDWSSSWLIRKIVGDCYLTERRILCGDATHVHSPAGGQGMNACMQDAFNLGWKLALVCSSAANASILETYPAERRPIAKQVTEGADRMHQILFNASIPIDERYLLTQDSAWHSDTIRRVSGLSHNYRGVDGVTDGLELDKSAVHPGDRAPDCIFQDRAPSLRMYDVLRHPGFTLLVVVRDTALADPYGKSIKQQMSRRFANHVKVVLVVPEKTDLYDYDHLVVDANASMARAFGLGNGGELVLVRPDLYVAARTSLDRSDVVEQYLARWISLPEVTPAVNSG